METVLLVLVFLAVLVLWLPLEIGFYRLLEAGFDYLSARYGWKDDLDTLTARYDRWTRSNLACSGDNNDGSQYSGKAR